MKRIILATALLLATLTGMASTRENDSIRYLASTLRQNWFVTANGSINWWQGSDRIPARNFTTLNGPSFGGGVSVGKWITHNLALRLSYDINRGKSFINGGHDGLTYLHFLYVDRTSPLTVYQDGTPYDYYNTSFMYHNLHADVMFSPVDLMLGYYAKRFYTPVVFVGMGAACVSEYVFVTKSFLKGEVKNFELSFDAGLMNNFRLNRYFELSLTAMLTGQRWTIDSWTYEYQGIRPRLADFNYSMLLGLTWNPSGGEDYGQRIYERGSNGNNDSLIGRIRELEEDIKRLANINDSLGGSVTIVHDTVFKYIEGENKFVSIPFSIFFRIDSDKIKSLEELYNISKIAEVAKQHQLTVHLRGSADSATATPEYNQRLSERRCETVKRQFVYEGVPVNKIEIEPVGGVYEIDPTKLDRRVEITLIKDLNH